MSSNTAEHDTKTPLPDDVTLCHEMLRSQAAAIRKQQRKIEQLEHYLGQLLRSGYGRKSEKIDPNQLTLFDNTEDPAAASAPPVPPETLVKEHTRRGGGRKPLPEDFPRERVEHDLPEKDKACPCCGELRQRIGSESCDQLEFIPSSLKILEHVRWKYACRRCEQHVAIARAPAKPIPKSVAGPGLLATLVVGKWSDHLPLYRLEDVLARQGVEVSRGTLGRWAASTAALLGPLYELMVRRVRSSEVIWTDDTPVKVQDPELPQCRTGRFWAYCGDWRNPYSVYDYTPSRRRDGPAAFLDGYQGYLQADAFAGYDGIYAGGLVKQVLCWAHVRRKFFDARTTKPEEAHAALAHIGRLYRVERDAKALADRFDLDHPGGRKAWHAERRELRQKYSLPVLNEFHEWLEGAQRRVTPKSPLGQAIRYVLPRWDGLSRYCEAGQCSIDNNLAERTLRACAIGRNYAEFGIMRSSMSLQCGFHA